MISYYDGQLTDLLPQNIMKKPEVKALSYALQQACRLLYQYSQRLYLYFQLDKQPEEIIDLLASELRTQYYNNTLDLETKRSLVKNTLTWYMSAGTPAAVEELVTVVFGEGKVEEWFEYGGNPYHFKIKTNAMLTPEINAFFSTMIQYVKNTRSHLENIEIYRTIEQPIYSGGIQIGLIHQAIIMDGVEKEGYYATAIS
ncbi:MAG: phage tail protein [Lachnospiraceae bacterium]